MDVGVKYLGLRNSVQLAHVRKLQEKCAMHRLGCWSVPARIVDLYQQQNFNFRVGNWSANMRFTQALFLDIQVSCKDTAP